MHMPHIKTRARDQVTDMDELYEKFLCELEEKYWMVGSSNSTEGSEHVSEPKCIVGLCERYKNHPRRYCQQLVNSMNTPKFKPIKFC